MLSLLHELHRAGATIAIITHDREIAAGLPRQVEMRDGRIVADSAVPVKVEGAGVTAVKPGRPALKPARLGPRDALRVSGTGLRTRPLRAFLSALGIAIGVAAMVAVVGISASSQAALDAMLAKLGTNLLTASAVDSAGVPGRLPKES